MGDMELTLKRRWFTDKSTIGELYIEDERECFTLEDTYRAEGDKVNGETAIPNGRYRVVIDWSKHFKRFMPHLLNVPGFEGVRIHSGNNKQEDTEGCILLGSNRGRDYVWESIKAYSHFIKQLEHALKAEEDVFINIKVEVA